MTTQLQRAINKASRVKCTVKLLGRRSYVVINPAGRKYVVTFHTHEGQRYGYCSCAAADMNQLCYHLIPAALTDTAIQNMRKGN